MYYSRHWPSWWDKGTYTALAPRASPMHSCLAVMMWPAPRRSPWKMLRMRTPCLSFLLYWCAGISGQIIARGSHAQCDTGPGIWTTDIQNKRRRTCIQGQPTVMQYAQRGLQWMGQIHQSNSPGNRCYPNGPTQCQKEYISMAGVT